MNKGKLILAISERFAIALAYISGFIAKCVQKGNFLLLAIALIAPIAIVLFLISELIGLFNRFFRSRR